MNNKNKEMSISAQTDREAMIELSGDIKSLRETIERFGIALIELEKNRVNNHEERIDKIEIWKNEIGGGWKLVVMASLFFGLLATVLVILSKINNG